MNQKIEARSATKQREQMNLGLREQIQAADSAAEVDCLHRQGATYTEASPRTRRRWARTATKRIAKLSEICGTNK